MAKSLASIKSFDQLLRYLDEELGWPVEDMEVDDLTFDYDPEEDLGLDPKIAAKIKGGKVRQLRPLTDSQPFGIFFVEFEPKRLPVTVLRRILGSLVTKKRSSANPSDRKTWQKDDLIFASVYGDDDTRRIDFAHFADDAENGLPTLRVLGWDDDDTERKLDWVHDRLRSKLSWPEKESATEWRVRWRDAFVLEHREVIRTSKELASQLAHLAQRIRKRVLSAMAAESKTKGPLHKLHKAFQDSLIHDLDGPRFADMYAQTIAYGLLSARMSRPHPLQGLNAEHAALMVPNTNPFLKELMEEFLRIGGRSKHAAVGRGKGIDFDELGVNDVVDLLRKVNVEAVIADFGRERPGEDPVIHFYEYFMQVYDKAEKVKRGVFYTPRPVVSFIVRSVDEILREEFGLPLGLADTTTWSEMAARKPAEGASPVTIPKGVEPGKHFVQVLDPATGTGTFLVEVIDLIADRMKRHWAAELKMIAPEDPAECIAWKEPRIRERWNEYVSEHLLPRLYGFELMMAPYAIAHMKIGLRLSDTGYDFQSTERLRVFLTNSLEPPTDLSEMLEFVAPFLAHEARAATSTKRRLRPSVIIGNPPYAGVSSNLSPSARELANRYKFVEGTRIKERGALQLEKNLNDDYVKFFSWCEQSILPAIGVLGFVTNDGYLDTPTLRGMRWNLLRTFDLAHVTALYGSVKRAEDGDENVFDIQQGVAIAVLARRPGPSIRSTLRGNLIGSREFKYRSLENSTARTTNRLELRPVSDLWLLRPLDAEITAEYSRGVIATDLFQVYSSGSETGFDELLVGWSKESLRQCLLAFSDPTRTSKEIEAEFGVSKGNAARLLAMRAEIRREVNRRFDDLATVGLYRPFDKRVYFYRTDLFKTNSRAVMQHLIGRDNFALVLFRQQASPGFTHAFVCDAIGDKNAVSLRTREINYYFPILVYPEESGIHAGRRGESNLTNHASQFGKVVPDQNPCEIGFLLYAQCHSPEYRRRYEAQLCLGFPRFFVPDSPDLAHALCAHGRALVGLHLLNEEAFGKARHPRPLTEFIGTAGSEVKRVGNAGKTMAPSPKGTGFGRVYINDTAYFDGVPEAVWKFHIGGYQVCHKWLSDRKGRTLTDEDIAHYHKIVIALNETIRIMGEIDKVIDEHGGWPGAFVTEPLEPAKSTASAAKTPKHKGGADPEEPALPFA